MGYLVDFFTSWSSLVGLLLVAVTLVDVGVTVMAVSSGPGPITGAVSKGLWWGFRSVHKRVRIHSVLRAAGPLIVLTVVTTWLLLMILGWGLVFGQEGSLLQEGETLEPAWGRIHYAASLILGRGTGSFNPAGFVWRFAEQLAALTGVAFVGITLAYVLPVIAAVVHKRQVAATIATLGGNPIQVLTRAWNGRDFGDLNLHIIALVPEIALLSQRHLAYPVVAYFHSSARHTALAPSLVVLDETLTILDLVDGEVGLGPTTVDPCRAAMGTFLRAAEGMGIRARGASELPRPSLGPLRDAGIPLPPAEDIDEAYEAARDRRSRLAAYLTHDGGDPRELHDHVHEDDLETEPRD